MPAPTTIPEGNDNNNDAELRCVAANPGTDPETLNWLARHTGTSIRAAVAGNPAAPPAALELLAADPAPIVRLTVVANPQCGPQALRVAAGKRHTGTFARFIATNPCTPDDVLRLLIDDPSPLVRTQTEHHPNASEQTRLAIRLRKQAFGTLDEARALTLAGALLAS